MQDILLDEQNIFGIFNVCIVLSVCKKPDIRFMLRAIQTVPDIRPDPSAGIVPIANMSHLTVHIFLQTRHSNTQRIQNIERSLPFCLGAKSLYERVYA